MCLPAQMQDGLGLICVEGARPVELDPEVMVKDRRFLTLMGSIRIDLL